MDEAYRRLKTGQYSVTEVGYDMGYNSLSKFSEMFKKVKGINPKEVIPV
ncbi:MAG: helix-turn-helix domain-containing protein [Bacteroidales bacterium]|nr:helix-turn-helix domain-containing protein [Bacteroidales bacterium]